MANYEKTEWKSGDVVTSAKLNKIEQGLEDALAGGSGGTSSFDLSDVLKQGVDEHGVKVKGAVVEGLIEYDTEYDMPANEASGEYSHAEGRITKASEYFTHAEGLHTQATGLAAHAEGVDTVASGQRSHAEGNSTSATGGNSHAEGDNTTASNSSAHAEGASTVASGLYSHAEGNATIAKRACQHVFGRANVPDPTTDGSYAEDSDGEYIEIVGNGGSSESRSNARTLDWSGNEKLAGSLTLGMDTADEVTITATQLTQLLALLS